MDEITMDVEILSISESTPEVSFVLLTFLIVGCDGPCLLKNAYEACI